MSSLNWAIWLVALLWGLGGWIFVILYHRLTNDCLALLERMSAAERQHPWWSDWSSEEDAIYDHVQ